MSYKLEYSKEADKTITIYKKSNPSAYKKFLNLIKEITEHPRIGTGHPEPLIKGSDIRYSRRITGNSRIIYDIFDAIVTIEVISVSGHYGDK